jgi:FkbM family methyltransferase
MWADTVTLSGRDAALKRAVLADPADPAEYWRLIIPRMSEIAPPDLGRMARWCMVLDPAEPQGKSVYMHAVRMHRGQQARRSVLPVTSRTRTVSFADQSLSFQDGGASAQFFSRVMPDGAIHEIGLLSYLRDHVRAGDRVVDVGAHIGYVACFAAAFGATVLAVETQPTLVPVIAANAMTNGLWRVHPMNAAMGARPGLAQSARLDPSPGLLTVSEKPRSHHYGSASLNHDIILRACLDDLSLDDEGPPAYVKIDVEGAEALVVAGARRLIEAGRTTFLVEIHPELLSTFGSTRAQILDAFPADRYHRGLLREDGRVEAVPAEAFAREAVRADNYMIVFTPIGSPA